MSTDACVRVSATCELTGTMGQDVETSDIEAGTHSLEGYWGCSPYGSPITCGHKTHKRINYDLYTTNVWLNYTHRIYYLLSIHNMSTTLYERDGVPA